MKDSADVFRIDELCVRFERAWTETEDPPDIAKFLELVEPGLQAELLPQLVSIDVDHRQQGDLPNDLEQYIATLPHHEALLREMFGQVSSSTRTTNTQPAAYRRLQPILASAGDMIGPYEIVKKIGEGGMGVVYLAQQHRPIERQVALKVIKAGLDTEQVIARFEAERQALALMDHPNIARVFDAGTTQSGRPYFVMEFVDGVTLCNHCDGHRLSLRMRLKLFVRLCNAMQHAHQKGIIHRDIKPSNVLVTQIDGRSVPKVIDFGLAKATSVQLTQRTLFTRFGELLGTLEYMSPEQTQLNSVDVDTRSDIYSLGVLLYELLTGTKPFDQSRFHRVAFDQILQIIRQEDPLKPSAQVGGSEGSVSIARACGSEPGKLTSYLRGDIDCIVMKALDKDRNRRYASAAALGEDVSRFLKDKPVEARPPSMRYLATKTFRRYRSPIVAAGIALALLIAALLGTGTMWLRANNAIAENKQLFFDLYTSLGNQAGEDNDPALASLWFASSIRQASNPDDSNASKIRTKLWSRQPNYPVRALWHSGDVLKQINFSSNCEFIATLTDEGTLRVWQILEDQVQHTVDDVTSFTWHPIRSYLAVGYESGEIRVIDVNNDNIVTFRAKISGPVTALRFHGGGDILGAADNVLRLWNLSDGKADSRSFIHPAPVLAIEFSSDDEFVVTACDDRLARVFSAAGDSPEPVMDPVAHRARIFRHCPPKPARVLNGSLLVNPSGGLVMGYDLDTKKPLAIARLPGKGCEFLVPSPNGEDFVVGGGLGGAAELWSARSRRRICRLMEENWLECAAMSPAGDRVALAGRTGSYLFTVAANGGASEPLFLDQGDVHCLQFSASGRYLAIGHDCGLVQVWDLSPERSMSSTIKLDGEGSDVATSSDSSLLLPSGCTWWWAKLHRTRVYSADSLKPVGPTLEPGGIILDACFTVDQQYVVTATSEKEVCYWDWRSGSRAKGPITLPFEPRAVECDPSGSTLVIATDCGRLEFRDAATSKLKFQAQHGAEDTLPLRRRHRRLNHYEHPEDNTASGRSVDWDVRILHFSSNGNWVVTAGYDEWVHVWNCFEDVPSQKFPALKHAEEVRHAALSPCDRYLCTISIFGSVFIWDFRNGELMATLDHSERVRYAAFSPDGRTLLTGCQDGITRLWNWSEESLAARPIQDSSIGGAFICNGDWILTTSFDRPFAKVWDRAGRAVSPPYRLNRRANRITLRKDGREAFMSAMASEGRSMGWPTISRFKFDNLVPLDFSNDDLSELTEILSRRRIDRGGVVVLSAQEWVERWSSFNKRHPDFFKYDLAEENASASRIKRTARDRSRDATKRAPLLSTSDNNPWRGKPRHELVERLSSAPVDARPELNRPQEEGTTSEDHRNGSRIFATKVQMSSLKSCIHMYMIRMNALPESLESLRDGPRDAANATRWVAPIITEIPTDAWGNPFDFVRTGTTFTIRSRGPDGVSANEDDITVKGP